VFTALYEQIDRTLASNARDAIDDLPMWMPLLFIAEPAGMRRCGAPDVEAARTALRWALLLWNAGRGRSRQRERAFAGHQATLGRTFRPALAEEMVLRAGLWPDDRRRVTRARIVVLPDGSWHLDIHPS
jgi:hypothetical protein